MNAQPQPNSLYCRHCGKLRTVDPYTKRPRPCECRIALAFEGMGRTYGQRLNDGFAILRGRW